MPTFPLEINTTNCVSHNCLCNIASCNDQTVYDIEISVKVLSQQMTTTVKQYLFCVVAVPLYESEGLSSDQLTFTVVTDNLSHSPREFYRQCHWAMQ